MAFSLNYARDLQALFRGLLNIPRGFIEQVNHGKKFNCVYNICYDGFQWEVSGFNERFLVLPGASV